MLRPAAFVLLGVTLSAFAPATPALAGPPQPGLSHAPDHLLLVGANAAGQPDPAGAFTVVVHDLADNPVAGSRVRVDFSDATDLNLCAVQAAGIDVINLPGLQAVEATADAQGRVTMSLIGCANVHAPVSPRGAITISADGVTLGSCSGAALDLDGCDGLHSTDMSAWLSDFLGGTSPARSDFDGDGNVGGSDLSVWVSSFRPGVYVYGCQVSPGLSKP